MTPWAVAIFPNDSPISHLPVYLYVRSRRDWSQIHSGYPQIFEAVLIAGFFFLLPHIFCCTSSCPPDRPPHAKSQAAISPDNLSVFRHDPSINRKETKRTNRRTNGPRNSNNIQTKFVLFLPLLPNCTTPTKPPDERYATKEIKPFHIGFANCQGCKVRGASGASLFFSEIKMISYLSFDETNIPVHSFVQSVYAEFGAVAPLGLIAVVLGRIDWPVLYVDRRCPSIIFLPVFFFSFFKFQEIFFLRWINSIICVHLLLTYVGLLVKNEMSCVLLIHVFQAAMVFWHRLPWSTTLLFPPTPVLIGFQEKKYPTKVWRVTTKIIWLFDHAMNAIFFHSLVMKLKDVSLFLNFFSEQCEDWVKIAKKSVYFFISSFIMILDIPASSPYSDRIAIEREKGSKLQQSASLPPNWSRLFFGSWSKKCSHPIEPNERAS